MGEHSDGEEAPADVSSCAGSRLRILDLLPDFQYHERKPDSHLLLVEGAAERAAGRAGAREEDAKTFSSFLIAIAVVFGTCVVALLGCAAARRGCIAIGSECALRVRLISWGSIRGTGDKAERQWRVEKRNREKES